MLISRDPRPTLFGGQVSWARNKFIVLSHWDLGMFVTATQPNASWLVKTILTNSSPIFVFLLLVTKLAFFLLPSIMLVSYQGSARQTFQVAMTILSRASFLFYFISGELVQSILIIGFIFHGKFSSWAIFYTSQSHMYICSGIRPMLISKTDWW